ncbi:MAG: PEP-CTERM sorting domain-containing protein [Planctomycetota bacterium]|jgi:hypothetical protein
MFRVEKALHAAALMAVVAIFASAGEAEMITVANHSFENGSGTTQDGNWWTDAMVNAGGTRATDTTLLTDWTITVNPWRFGGRFDPNDNHYTDATNGAPLPDLPSPADGQQVAFFHCGTGAAPNCWFTITSTNSLENIRTGIYTLTVAVGTTHRWTGTPSSTSWGNFDAVRLRLLGTGDAIIATSGNVGSPAAGSGQFVDKQLVFDNSNGAYTGEPLKIDIYCKDDEAFQHVNFDNVRLEYVPEPATTCLLAVGAAGAFARRRKR